MGGFKKFLLRGNVVDLAVAVVIGAAFGAVVTAFVSAFITPLVGVFTGAAGDFSERTFTFSGAVFPYGRFVQSALSFAIIAAVVYFLVVVPVGRLMDKFRTEPELDAPVKECPECLSKIPELAHRCAFCSAEQPTSLGRVPVAPPPVRVTRPEPDRSRAAASPARSWRRNRRPQCTRRRTCRCCR